MDPRTVKFIIFMIFSLLCLGGGYLAREKNFLKEETSNTFHFYVVTMIWTPVSLLAFWKLEINIQLAYLLLSQPVLLLSIWGFVWLAGRLMKLERGVTAVLILSCALSNVGFTMGAYLCYTLFENGDLAFSYAIACVSSFAICIILIFYPIASYYAAEAPNRAETMKLMAKSLVNVRSLSLHASLVGIVLNLAGAPYPDWVHRIYLLDILFFAAAAGNYLGIGLRLQFRRGETRIALHAVTAAVKFVALPLLTLGILAMLKALGMAPSPLAAGVILLESCMPTAISAVMVANLFDLDSRLASELWFFNTLLFSARPLILVIWYFGQGPGAVHP